MALNLRKLSFDHFLLLGLDEACCLHAAAVISDIGARRTGLFGACAPVACSFPSQRWNFPWLGRDEQDFLAFGLSYGLPRKF